MPVIAMTPIGVVRSTRAIAEDDRWDSETSTLELDAAEFTAEALAGLDAIDGTPVLDLKPWVQEFGPRGELHQPAWISELMTEYWTAPT
jgi:tRNA (Thr-GGU) A37 N-methylase